MLLVDKFRVDRHLSTAVSGEERSGSTHAHSGIVGKNLPGLFFSKLITIIVGGAKPRILRLCLYIKIVLMGKLVLVKDLNVQKRAVWVANASVLSRLLLSQ